MRACRRKLRYLALHGFSMSQRPLLIGVSPRIRREVPAELGLHDKSMQYLEQSVAQWILGSAALCLMLPTAQTDGSIAGGAVAARDYADALDGLVLQGGADLDPALYGQQPEHIIGATDPVRDRFELDLVRAFTRVGKPVFGICRGMQLINVALGGSLHQDLVANGATDFAHVQRSAYDRHRHPLRIVAGSLFSRWYGGLAQSSVNSIHHQGVARLGNGLDAVAFAHDGVVEAIWSEQGGFVLGVQWHPEFQFQAERDPELLDSAPMMRAFLDAARVRRDCGNLAPG